MGRSGMPADRAALAAVAVAATVVLVIALLAAVATDLWPVSVLRDPAQVTGVGPLVGAISNLGVLIWWSSACIALFVAYLLRTVPQAREPRRFLVVVGLISVYLCLDDLFLLHDDVVPGLTPLPQPAFLVLMGAAIALGLFMVRGYLATTEWALLLFAGLLLGGSVASDIGAHLLAYLGFGETPELQAYLEDILKWFGLVTWATYVLRSTLAAVRGSVPALAG